MAASEGSNNNNNDGPVMSLMNKRLRALKKKYNRILQTEEAIAQGGKSLYKEQEDLLRSKPSVVTLIDEYEKLRQPLSIAIHEELNLAHQHNQVTTVTPQTQTQIQVSVEKSEKDQIFNNSPQLEDLIKLLYFGCLFDVKQQSDFTNTMLTRTHERGCCLTYDYVTDDATDLLGEKDLDLISMLGSLVVSRPVHSGLSHKNALQSCLQHAKLWLSNADQPIEDGVNITYAGLRERLDKILASDYFTTTPEMKAPVEVAAAAAGNYTSSHVPVQGSSESSEVTVHTESDFANYEQKDEEIDHSEGQETGADQSIPIEELVKESEMPNAVDGTSLQQDQKPEGDVEEQNFRDVESKDQQQNPRRGYQNYRGGNRGGGGGRRGYPNGRGGRGSRGGGGYQNGRSSYNDQPGNYYPRNYSSSRGRGGRGAGGNTYNNQGYAHGGHAPATEMGS
ncbi:glycine-rich protein [Thalictrum thalictroides]|uniref:Glycine-rich protein n=1 Tax=Thalictrum thalictroides TaxID=46969 RepID=A0A7J6X868_THATH|nr:glycine-rich protein [Thalictrum thalictroides]